MDIDCDGANKNTGACSDGGSDSQGQTSFQDVVSQFGISDLDATIHPYVVFGNVDDSPSFDPTDYGMQKLSVMAIVCQGQVV